MDPLEFLRGHHPFDRLGDDALKQVGASLEISYCAAGTRVLERGGPVSRYLYVVRKGAVRLERDGQLQQVIEEGECFGFPSLIGRRSPHADAVASEDTLLYQLPADAFESLMARGPFAEFFLEDLSDRLRRSAALPPNAVGSELAAPVAHLSTRLPLWVDPAATVGEAARTMHAQGVSSLLVSGHPPGIVTDRDLRSRVLAADQGPMVPVGDVATRPVRTLAESATLLDALVFMLEQRVHHVPLEREGAITGLVTDTDLLRWQVQSPLALLGRLDRLAVPDDLPRYGGDVAAMVEALHASRLDAAGVGPLVARVNDALVARLLRQAEESLGPAPCPYAWIVFGSEGRLEQTLLTDQDNGLVYAAGEDAGARRYFDALASLVVGWLVRAGFPTCPGDFMATTWCHPLDWWTARVGQWIDRPEPRALMDAMNVLDFRRAHGPLSLEPLDRALRAAGREGRFLAHLARASTGLTPPIGAFHRLKREGGGVDLKKGGLLPVVGLARLLALEAGSAARSTLERLEAAARSGILSAAGAATLGEAFRFLLDLRMREQLRAVRHGEPVDNMVALARLTTLEQRHLKDVFVAIREHQQAVALRYAVDQLA